MSLPSIGDVGILRSHLFPNLVFYTIISPLSSVSEIQTQISRFSTDNRKVWSTIHALGLWWFAFGQTVLYERMPLRTVAESLGYKQWALLAGVTLYGLHLPFTRPSRKSTRSIETSLHDSIIGGEHPDVRVANHERAMEPDWNDWKAIVRSVGKREIRDQATVLLQSIIALPFTAPFVGGSYGIINCPTGYQGAVEVAALGLFGVGLALSKGGDWERRRKRTGLRRAVRHPGILGDTLIHTSLSLYLFSSQLLHPLFLVSPILNYLVLRYGPNNEEERDRDAEWNLAINNPGELSKVLEEKNRANAVWPGIKDVFTSQWSLVAAGAGAVAMVLDRAARRLQRV